jgi:hypothetical protein
MLSSNLRNKLLTIAIVLSSFSILQAQQNKPAVPQAPVPAQIANARKIFIAYNGGNSDVANYSGDSNRTYNQFYSAIKNWGQYEVVATPASADLVFEIGFVGANSRLTLAIRDPKSNVLLWRLNRYVQEAALAGNRDKNFNQAMDYLLDDIKRLVGTPLPAVQTVPQ